MIGVLICNPVGHEYFRSHWALRQLAVHLSSKGYHVLRFDYYGTGDSAGSTAMSGADQWIEDIQTAAEEIRDIAGVQKINLIGLRLGASLALDTAEKLKNIAKIILWDPLTAGHECILQLREFYEKMCIHVDYSPSGRHFSHKKLPEQLLGLSLSKNMVEFIEKKATLDHIVACKQKLYILFSSLAIVSEADFEKMQKLPENICLCELIEDQGEWNSFEDIGKIVYPGKVIQYISQEIL